MEGRCFPDVEGASAFPFTGPFRILRVIVKNQDDEVPREQPRCSLLVHRHTETFPVPLSGRVV